MGCKPSSLKDNDIQLDEILELQKFPLHYIAQTADVLLFRKALDRLEKKEKSYNRRGDKTTNNTKDTSSSTSDNNSINDNIINLNKNLNTILSKLINKKDDYEYTPLHIAATNGNLGIVTFLIDEMKLFVDLNIQDYKGETPLLAACQAGNVAIAIALAAGLVNRLFPQ